MVNDHVFPEDEGTGGYGSGAGDYNDAQNFAQLIRSFGVADRVISGLSFTVDYANLSVDISSGVATISDSSATATQSNETRNDVGYVVQASERSGLSLTDNDVNHIYIDVDLSNEDDVSIAINTSGTAPSSTSLKIGEVDTSNDVLEEVNRGYDINITEFSTAGSSGDAVKVSSSGGVTTGDLGPGVTATDRGLINDMMASIARNNFENGENEVPYDGGFYDIFSDKRKISGFYDVGKASYNEFSYDVSQQDDFSYGVSWNDDGSKMYIVGAGNSSVYEYDVSTNYRPHTASFSKSFSVSNQDSQPTGMAWNDDGSKLYVAGVGTSTVYEYDLSTPYDIGTASFNNSSLDVSGKDRTPRGITFDDTGSRIYIAGAGSSSVLEYDLTTKYDISSASFNQSFDVSDEDGTPTSITWDSDGSLMHILGNDNQRVYQYDLETTYDISSASYSKKFFVGEESAPNGLDWNNNGTKMYVVGSFDDTVYEYKIDALNNTAVSTLIDNPGSDGIVELSETFGAPQSLETNLSKPFVVNSVSWSPGGNYIAYGDSENNVYVHNVSDWSLEKKLTQSGNSIESVDWSPDGNYIAYGGGDDNVYVHNVSDWSLAQTLTQSGGTVYSVSWSPDGKYVAYGTQDNDVYIHNVSNWSLSQTLSQAGSFVLSVTWSPDYKYIAYGSIDANVYIHSLGSWSLEKTLSQSGDDVQSVSWDPKNRYVAYSGRDNNAYVHNAPGWGLEQTLGQSGDDVPSVSWSPDGKYISYGGGSDVYVHSVSDWSLKETLSQLGSSVYAVAFSQENRYIAYGGNDSKVPVHSRPFGYITSGSFTSTNFDLADGGFSSPPTSVVASQDADIPSDEDIQYVLTDGDGNTVTIKQSDVDEKVDTSSFTSTEIGIKTELSSSDGNDTPTLRSYMMNFKE